MTSRFCLLNKIMPSTKSFKDLFNALGILLTKNGFNLYRWLLILKTEPSTHLFTITPLNYFWGKNHEKTNIDFKHIDIHHVYRLCIG